TEVAFPGQILSAKHQLVAEPYVFADAGWVWNRFSPAGGDPRAIGSLGAGVRTNWGDRARLDMALAVPTRTAGPTQAGDVRFLLTLTTRLVPWSAK
ncbi:hemolysin activation/secretion protein, partial [Polymorphobacter multimanifer]|nr:hemolysin activation/secretion protein [Polymorphobacter multimanifer]